MKKRIFVLFLMAAALFVFASCNKEEPPIVNDEVEITLNKEEVSLNISETFQMVVEVLNTEETVVWSIDNPSIATVSQNGLITAVSSGTTYAHATIDDVSESVKIIVLEKHFPILSLSHDEVEILVDSEDFTVTATVKFKDVEQDVEVSWAVEDDSIATVLDGVITPVGVGETTITVSATFDDILLEETIIVKIKEAEFIDVLYVTMMSNGTGTLDKVGSEFGFEEVSIFNSNGALWGNRFEVKSAAITEYDYFVIYMMISEPMTKDMVFWMDVVGNVSRVYPDGRINNPIKIYDEDGKLYEKAPVPGEFYEFVIELVHTDDDYRYAIGIEQGMDIYIADPHVITTEVHDKRYLSVELPELVLSDNKVTLSEDSEDFTVTATVKFKDVEQDVEVSWAVEDDSIATVLDGVITPVGVGETTITVSATFDDVLLEEIIVVKVNEKAPTLALFVEMDTVANSTADFNKIDPFGSFENIFIYNPQDNLWENRIEVADPSIVEYDYFVVYMLFMDEVSADIIFWMDTVASVVTMKPNGTFSHDRVKIFDQEGNLHEGAIVPNVVYEFVIELYHGDSAHRYGIGLKQVIDIYVADPHVITKELHDTRYAIEEVPELVLSHNYVELSEDSEDFTVTATVKFEGLEQDVEVSWTVEDDSIATVLDGVITPVRVGETTIIISAVFNDVLLEETITVRVNEEGFSDQLYLEMVGAGESEFNEVELNLGFDKIFVYNPKASLWGNRIYVTDPIIGEYDYFVIYMSFAEVVTKDIVFWMDIDNANIVRMYPDGSKSARIKIFDIDGNLHEGAIVPEEIYEFVIELKHSGTFQYAIGMEQDVDIYIADPHVITSFAHDEKYLP